MYKMELPSRQYLDAMKKEQRFNLFRKFLAISRHNRLILHHELVKSTNDLPLRSHIDTLDRVHISSYYEFVDYIKNNLGVRKKDFDECMIKSYLINAHFLDFKT